MNSMFVKNMFEMPARLVLLACVTIAPPVWAQQPQNAASAPTRDVTASRESRHEEQVEQRIQQLHAQLGVTAQEEPQWNAFAQAMRDDAQTGGAALMARAEKQRTENADDAMQGYATLARLHADNMQKLAQSFGALYASLSDAQKQAADRLFRHPRWQKVKAKVRRAPQAGDVAPGAN
jgi:protein CpxP